MLPHEDAADAVERVVLLGHAHRAHEHHVLVPQLLRSVNLIALTNPVDLYRSRNKSKAPAQALSVSDTAGGKGLFEVFTRSGSCPGSKYHSGGSEGFALGRILGIADVRLHSRNEGAE